MATLWENKALANTLVRMGTPPDLATLNSKRARLGSLDDALPLADGDDQ